MQQSFQEVHIPSCVFMHKMYCFPASVLLITGTVFKKAVLQPLKAKNTDYAWKGSSSRCLLEKSMLNMYTDCFWKANMSDKGCRTLFRTCRISEFTAGHCTHFCLIQMTTFKEKHNLRREYSRFCQKHAYTHTYMRTYVRTYIHTNRPLNYITHTIKLHYITYIHYIHTFITYINYIH
jgi:hypothetical protein